MAVGKPPSHILMRGDAHGVRLLLSLIRGEAGKPPFHSLMRGDAHGVRLLLRLNRGEEIVGRLGIGSAQAKASLPPIRASLQVAVGLHG